MQNQTSNTLHNAIMEAGSKDRPPMLAPGNYVQWKSRIKRYIDPKPNHELIYYCLTNTPYKLAWIEKEVPISEGSPITRTEKFQETYKNVSQDIHDQLNAKAEAVQIILTGIDNDIYSTVDTCLNAERCGKQLKEWQRFVTLVKQSQELKTFSYHKLYDILKQHQNEVNEIRAERIAHVANLLALVAQQQLVYHPQNLPTHYTQNSSTRSQQAATRSRGKEIVNSPQPIYDQEPCMVAEDDETSKDKDIDKLMALISLSFKKIYKPNNNNLRTSSNTSRANQDNSPRINRSAGYENQRIGNVAKARETVGSTAVQKSKIQCYNCKEVGHVARECQKPKRAKDVAYHKENMLLCKQEEAGIHLNAEQADWRDDTDDDELEDQELEVSNDDHYNVFAIESAHPEQSKYVHDTYHIKQDVHNVIIDSLDMSYDREEIDQNDNDNDLANERELLASLIEKLKCEIDESKNRNKFLETSNKAKVKAVQDAAAVAHTNLNAKTLNVKFVCATGDKCVLNDKHDMCVLNSVEKPLKKTVASESNQNPKNITRKLYERVSKACSWWYPKFTPSGYKRKPKSGQENVNPNLVEIVPFIVDYGCSKHMTGNLKLLINFVEKFLGTVKFGNDQFAPIIGYGDLVQGAVMIKRVYYVEGLNHNLISICQFCDADLEVAFRKSTCYICDLKGNDLLTATSSQAWLWHRRLSHLNFDTINLPSKNDIVVKNKREKDKIRTKPNKNRKCGEAEKSQEQSQSIKPEKLKKMQVKGALVDDSNNKMMLHEVFLVMVMVFEWWILAENKEEGVKLIDISLEQLLDLKFRDHEKVDKEIVEEVKGGDDEEVFTYDEISDLDEENASEEKEFNHLLQIDVDMLTGDLLGFKTYEDYKNTLIYEWNNEVPWVE
nr:hypothetical protein [Tanacetum cinerariifolium]